MSWILNLIVGWNELSLVMKWSMFPYSGKMIKMSSMYLVRRSGLISRVDMNFLNRFDIKMFATAGDSADPIAIPLVWWNVSGPNLKKLFFRCRLRSSIIKFGLNNSRLWCFASSRCMIDRHSSCGMDGNKLTISSVIKVLLWGTVKCSSLFISAVELWR